MKRVLITGGTRGIGLAISRKFASEGYLVTATYSNNEEDAENARKACPAVTFLKADVSSEDDVQRVISSMPSVDVLVNNAGIDLYCQVQDASFSDWQRVMNVNAGGAFLTTKYAVKKMISCGGSIVNIASIWGETGGSMESVYSASKGALIAFTKATAKELAGANIRVNCVSPGMVSTSMNDLFSEEEKQAFYGEVPLKRAATVEEIARAVYFLSVQPYITGQILKVNGGYYM